jgi:hypothetical protein
MRAYFSNVICLNEFRVAYHVRWQLSHDIWVMAGSPAVFYDGIVVPNIGYIDTLSNDSLLEKR